jgi:hypothetical protein
MAIRKNADGHQHGTVYDGAVDSDFFVSGIENQVMDLVQLAVSPSIQFLVEQLSGSTYLPTGESSPQSSLVIAASFRVETPWT